jgi:transposase
VAGIYCLALIGDKAFDAHWLRNRLAGARIEAVIPLREGTSGHAAHDKDKYTWRHLIENFCCKMKGFRRIATRYEKTDAGARNHLNVLFNAPRLKVTDVLWARKGVRDADACWALHAAKQNGSAKSGSRPI